jgi:hypothetical protein
MIKNISERLNDAVRSVVSGQTLAEGSKEEYEKFFRAALKKFGAESPADLDDEKKKEFFDYVDTNYKGEKTEESVKRYTFSVEEDDPDPIEKKDDDEDEEEDSVDEDSEDGNISPETVNAVIKLLNKRKLESKKAKTEEDEKDEDEGEDKEDKGEDKDKEEKGEDKEEKPEDKEEKPEDKEEKDDEKSSKKTTPKEKTPEEERKEEGRPPIKLSGKKNKVNVNK